MIGRLTRAWKALAPEQRLAGGCAAALFFTMFLPWYTHSGFSKTQAVEDSLSAWEAFSFVEAAVLLVAAGVLFLLFLRAERRAFHLPGGDGMVILAGGAWAALLTFYRTLDKPDASPGTIVGVDWGIFVAILAALGLVYAGNRLRAAHVSEPPLPAAGPDGPPTDPTVVDRRASARAQARARYEAAMGGETATSVAPASRRARPEIDGGEQLSFDEQE